MYLPLSISKWNQSSPYHGVGLIIHRDLRFLKSESQNFCKTWKGANKQYYLNKYCLILKISTRFNLRGSQILHKILWGEGVPIFHKISGGSKIFHNMSLKLKSIIPKWCVFVLYALPTMQRQSKYDYISDKTICSWICVWYNLC